MLNFVLRSNTISNLHKITMATVRRPREMLDNGMNIQDENDKLNPIQLRSKANVDEAGQMKMPLPVHGKSMATRLSRQQRGALMDIGNNPIQVNAVKTKPYIEAITRNDKENTYVKQNVALPCQNENSVHQSVIEEPKAKRKHYGESILKPVTEMAVSNEGNKDIEDVDMISPTDVIKEAGVNFMESGDVSMAEHDNIETSVVLRSAMPPLEWEDVDMDDMEDPQMVSEYVNDIFAYLCTLENKYTISESYLRGKKGVILPKMRAVLTDWMVEVHQQFTLLQETLYLSIAILDRYMQVAAETVPRKRLQLVGVTAMFIAAKYEEMYAPEIGDFVYITDNAYSESQIREQEVDMIKQLNFNLERPLPLQFLRRYSKVAQVDTTIHNLAKYIMELTVVEYKFCHVLPSKVAAVSLAISMMAYESDPKKTIRQLWNSTVEHYTFYKFNSIAGLVQEIAGYLLKISRASESTRIMAVRKKYSDKKFLGVSVSSEVVGFNVVKLAEGKF